MVYQNPNNGSTVFYPNTSLGYEPVQQQQQMQMPMQQPQQSMQQMQGQSNTMQMQTPQQPFVQQQQVMFPQMTVNGKIVDGKAMVGVSDVPVGGYGLFPKADLSEIYIKRWNSFGTTDTITYKPVQEDILEEENSANTVNQLVEQINRMEAKIDSWAAFMSQQNIPQNTVSEAQSLPAQQQEPQNVRQEVPQNQPSAPQSFNF